MYTTSSQEPSALGGPAIRDIVPFTIICSYGTIHFAVSILTDVFVQKGNPEKNRWNSTPLPSPPSLISSLITLGINKVMTIYSNKKENTQTVNKPRPIWNLTLIWSAYGLKQSS